PVSYHFQVGSDGWRHAVTTAMRAAGDSVVNNMTIGKLSAREGFREMERTMRSRMLQGQRAVTAQFGFITGNLNTLVKNGTITWQQFTRELARNARIYLRRIGVDVAHLRDSIVNGLASDLAYVSNPDNF